MGTITYICKVKNPCPLSSKTTAKGTGFAETVGKEDPVELDSKHPDLHST